MIFSTVEAQKVAPPVFANKLASDRRKQPYFDQVTVLIQAAGKAEEDVGPRRLLLPKPHR
jgi:hypothetical protein